MRVTNVCRVSENILCILQVYAHGAKQHMESHGTTVEQYAKVYSSVRPLPWFRSLIYVAYAGKSQES